MTTKVDCVIKRSGAVVPFNPERIFNAIYRAAVAVGGRDKEKAWELTGKVVDKLEVNVADGHTPSIEEIQDIVEKILIESGHAKVAKAYILYREEAAHKRHAEGKKSSIPSENIPWAKIWRTLDWALDRNLNTVEGMNNRISKGEFPQIVHECEEHYDDDLTTASNLILERIDEIRMVLITGPSSSGKTTTTHKLEDKLKKRGYHFASLNVDHYFFDLEFHPKDEFGDYDFETPQALDLELINHHLVELAAGREVMLPFYDFKTGKRKLNDRPMRLKENEILLIDSLHGLYPQMARDISPENKFRIYLEPLMQVKAPTGKYIRWTDIRLIRRMLRDSVQRAYNPQQTLEHWHYVRASEMRNIIPYFNSADYIINSAMPYELSLYRHRMLSLFEGWHKLYKDNPLRDDAYIRAERVLSWMSAILEVSDDSPVPHDSVLREFIGGSSLKYH